MSSPLDELRQLNVAKQRQNGTQALETKEAVAQEPAEKDGNHAAPPLVSEKPAPVDMTGNTVIRSDSQSVTQQTGQSVSRSYDDMTGHIVQQVAREPEYDTKIDRLLEDALNTPRRTVTFKLCEGLDDLVSEYIAENWRSRPAKQDILAEALSDWLRKRMLEKGSIPDA